MEVSGQRNVPVGLTPGRDAGAALDLLEKRKIACPCPDSTQDIPDRSLFDIQTVLWRINGKVSVLKYGDYDNVWSVTTAYH